MLHISSRLPICTNRFAHQFQHYDLRGSPSQSNTFAILGHMIRFEVFLNMFPLIGASRVQFSPIWITASRFKTAEKSSFNTCHQYQSPKDFSNKFLLCITCLWPFHTFVHQKPLAWTLHHMSIAFLSCYFSRIFSCFHNLPGEKRKPNLGPRKIGCSSLPKQHQSPTNWYIYSRIFNTYFPGNSKFPTMMQHLHHTAFHCQNKTSSDRSLQKLLVSKPQKNPLDLICELLHCLQVKLLHTDMFPYVSKDVSSFASLKTGGFLLKVAVICAGSASACLLMPSIQWQF